MHTRKCVYLQFPTAFQVPLPVMPLFTSFSCQEGPLSSLPSRCIHLLLDLSQVIPTSLGILPCLTLPCVGGAHSLYPLPTLSRSLPMPTILILYHLLMSIFPIMPSQKEKSCLLKSLYGYHHAWQIMYGKNQVLGIGAEELQN